ncbi:MAG: cation transporter [Desulfurococcales archaeon]|nr:cation transporter [Desulfurococcales archaeon]
MGRGSWLALAIAAAVAGATVKVAGALLYGSKSLLADALTCIASLAALGASTRFYLASLEPPDEDHPYGHERLALAGPLVTALIYSAVAGYMLGELLHPRPYEVSIRAPVAAAVGAGFYAVSLLAARRLGEGFRGYYSLGWSEVLESIVVIVSSYLGASVSYLADYAGALVILGFIAAEVASTVRGVVEAYADVAAPRSVYLEARRILEGEGLRVRSLRIRVKAPGSYHGDATVACPPSASVSEVHEKLDSAREKLRSLSIDLAITVEPCRRREEARF